MPGRGRALTPVRRVRFDELTPTELCELLALRVRVFPIGVLP